jgi:hypothetical protein
MAASHLPRTSRNLKKPLRDVPLLVSLLLLLLGASPRQAPAARPGLQKLRVQLDRYPGSFSYIPVRDQRNLGICYAETAAQLIDSYRFSHGDPHTEVQTSGLHAAFVISQNQHRNTVEGGHVCEAVRTIEQVGSCDQKTVLDGFHLKLDRKEFIDELENRFLSFREEIKALGITLAELDPLSTGIESSSFVNIKLLQARNLRSSESRRLSQWLKAVGIPVSFTPAPDQIATLLTSSTSHLAFTEGVLMPSCAAQQKNISLYGRSSGRAVSKNPTCKEYNREQLGEKGLQRILDESLLSPNPQALAISYCAAFLKLGRRYRGVTHYGRSSHCPPVPPDPGEPRHASLIIGRSQDPSGRRVYYRLRNSWGKDCYSYASEWTCDNGNLWIPADALLSNTLAISRLE